MINKNTLLSKIKNYIDNPLPENGSGWPIVEENDIEDLVYIIRDIIDCHFPRDCDGDTPIEFEIIDRTKYEPRFFSPIPYRHTITDIMDYIKPLAFNASVATEKFSIALKLIENRKHYEKSKN